MACACPARHREAAATWVPAVAATLGVAVLGEAFTAGMAVGFVLVLIGSALATGRGPRWQRFRLDRLVGRAPPP